MVFGGADATLRGKGTMIVGGDVLVRDEGSFEKESEVVGSFVV